MTRHVTKQTAIAIAACLIAALIGPAVKRAMMPCPVSTSDLKTDRASQ